MTSTSPINDHPLDFSRILRPVPRASFSLLDDRPVLFSEAAQKIYELNEMAAYIWCCLLDDKPAEAICDDLTRFGLEPVAARNHLSQALQRWFKLGLLGADWKLSESHSFSASVGKLELNIHASSERLTQLLIPLFSEVGSVSEKAEDTFEVVEMGGSGHIFHNKACIARCTNDEVAPTLKAYLTEQVVLRSYPDISFHGACLLSGGKGLLVSGRPGAGKSTLALHLMEAGFEYAADDVVLIAPDGRATGVLFAPTLKPGAWSMVEKFRPDLSKSAVHKRPDGKRVRYLNSPRAAHRGSVPIGWIIFIKRVPNVPADFAPLGQLETISRLIDASYSPTGKLTDQAFGAIKRSVAEAKCFELRYSNAYEAKNAIVELCHA
ncbi:MAG TPA: PqqD family peptide modification chaperone [Gammaproteobacteria bacterium]|nr:PqqD family peptide modification chaperone [Gammaproteobacteria bacterium]